jgi:hypothetical protein
VHSHAAPSRRKQYSGSGGFHIAGPLRCMEATAVAGRPATASYSPRINGLEGDGRAPLRSGRASTAVRATVDALPVAGPSPSVGFARLSRADVTLRQRTLGLRRQVPDRCRPDVAARDAGQRGFGDLQGSRNRCSPSRRPGPGRDVRMPSPQRPSSGIGTLRPSPSGREPSRHAAPGRAEGVAPRPGRASTAARATVDALPGPAAARTISGGK